MKKPSIKKETPTEQKWYPFFPFLIFTIACLQYVNTCSNDYAWDDALVIRDNAATQKGLAGIKDIWTKPVYIPQRNIYRPIPQTTFALGQHFFGDQPSIGHAVNVLLYGICCMLLFITLQRLLPDYHIAFALLASLLFVVHPVHTEVVANIKSRDEILALIFSLCSLFYFIKYLNQRQLLSIIAVAIFFILALLSKLNAITILAIYPLVYVFRQQNIAQQKNQIGQYAFQFQLLEKNAFPSYFSLVPAIWQPVGLIIFLVLSVIAVVFNLNSIAALCILYWSFLLWQKQDNLTISNWTIAAILLAFVGIFFSLNYSIFTGMLICIYPLIHHKKWHIQQLIPFGILAISLPIIEKPFISAAPILLILLFAYALHKGKQQWTRTGFLLLAIFPFLAMGYIKIGLFMLFLSGLAHFYNKLNTKKTITFLAALLCIIAFLELFITNTNSNNISHQIHQKLFPPKAIPDMYSEKKDIKIIKDNELDLTAINNSLVNISSIEEKYTTIAGIQLRYLGKLIFPYALVHSYGANAIPMLSWKHWMPWLSLLIHFGLLVFAAFRIFRGDPIAFGILFYFITISIYSHFVRLGPDTMAERFLFFPSVGFVIAITFFLVGLCKANVSKKPFSTTRNILFFGLFFLICTGFFIRSFIRNMDWKDNRTLASNTLKFAPNNALIHANYASEWMHVFEQNPTDPKLAHIPQDATAAYEKAIAIYPNYFNAILDLGNVYLKWGKTKLAQQTFQKGIKVNPKNPLPDYYLGLLAFSETNYNNGITQLETCQKKYAAMGKENFITDEIYQQSFMFLARCHFKAGNLPQADAVLQKATAELPTQSMFLVLLGKMYAEQGDLPNAIKHLEAALHIAPSDQSIRSLLYDYHSLLGNTEKAQEYGRPQ